MLGAPPHLRYFVAPFTILPSEVVSCPFVTTSPYCFRHLSEVSERNCRLWGGREGVLIGPETRRAWI